VVSAVVYSFIFPMFIVFYEKFYRRYLPDSRILYRY